MNVRSTSLLMGILLASGLGCNKLGGTPEGSAASSTAGSKAVGGVGVVDLDSLAKQLGRDQQMARQVQQQLTALNGKLTKLKETLERLFEEKRTSFGSEPNEDQSKQLLAMQDRMDAQLGEAKRKAELELANYKQTLIDQFREQTKPILRDVASARGLSIVVPKNNGLLLTIDPSVEITDEVAQRILALRGKSPAAGPEEADADTGTETSSR